METLLEQETARESESWNAATMASPQLKQHAKKLTFEQASKLAAGRSFELIDGRIIFKMPDNKHSDAQMLLGSELVNYFKANPIPIGRVRSEYTLDSGLKILTKVARPIFP